MDMEKTPIDENKRELTFNQWAIRYNVGSAYVMRTTYFQGNPSSGFKPIKTENRILRFFKMLGF
jgi:hypothetical protein